MDPNWLFHPFTYTDFEHRYFEREVLLVKRNDPRYLSDLLSIDDLDHVFALHTVSYPEISLVKEGETIQRSTYVTDQGRLDAARTVRIFSQGATMIFNSQQSRLPKLGRLCADLETLFSQRMQTNIYLTPTGAQGFAPHWDTHDVFVLQVTGRKTWTIYGSPVALPLKGHTFDKTVDKVGDVTMEFELEPGDMVYIPRGYMHSAKASTETSLHITTGLVGHTWSDALLQAVAAAAHDDVSLRKSLPLGWGREGVEVESLVALFREKVERLMAHIQTAPPPFEQLASDLRESYASLARGILKRTVDATLVSTSTVVNIPAGSPWNLHQDGDACFVRAGTRELQLPAKVLPILEFLNQHSKGRVSDLPKSIDEAGKLVLVRRLITEGLLECA